MSNPTPPGHLDGWEERNACLYRMRKSAWMTKKLSKGAVIMPPTSANGQRRNHQQGLDGRAEGEIQQAEAERQGDRHHRHGLGF
jgi:hypothetical protein